jgi:hypothetical protein
MNPSSHISWNCLCPVAPSTVAVSSLESHLRKCTSAKVAASVKVGASQERSVLQQHGDATRP